MGNLSSENPIASGMLYSLQSQARQNFKRTMDVFLILASSPISVPLILWIAFLVRLTSPGPAFYAQIRIGHRGKKFRAWKFRTMAPNADQALDQTFQENPALQPEWDVNHKLKYDPRVTRFGNFLRKFSMDELPQIWNVLAGEMSLVGPRPIVEQEIELYGEKMELYKTILPGITGLWQVSGRNNLPYAERVRLDEVYILNWSIWMDLFISVKTIWVVITGNGAY